MSEIIDLESNNLCTTEDAFEKFQAVSMYEEDEYITLSDIVSPPRTSNDISEILKEVPGDDVSESLQDSGLNVNISTPSQENQVQVEDPECITIEEQNIMTNTAKKRGRKKKNGYGKKVSQNKSNENNSIKKPTRITAKNDNTTVPSEKDSDLNYDMIIGEEDLDVNKDVTERKITKQKRNIKRKSYDSITCEDIKDSNDKLLSKRGRPIKSKINIDVRKAELVDENKKVTKRGRKKKVSDISLNSEPLSNNETNLVQNNNSDCTTNETERDKNPDNNTELKNNDLEEDVPLVVLSTKTSRIAETSVNNLELSTDIKQKSLNDLTITSVMGSDLLTEKTPKKRGRPKKNNVSVIKLNLDSTDCEQRISKDNEDISLSKLKSEKEVLEIQNKETLEPKDSTTTQEVEENLPNDTVSKRNLKKPTMSDFEYNIDSIIKSNEKGEIEQSDQIDSLLNESSRPVRRRAQKHFDYDEGSDEDPYANVELSDDDPPRRKKGSRYFSDDEYIPGDRKRAQSDLSDSDIDEEDFGKQKKKKTKKLDLGLPNKSPKKRGRKSNGDKTMSQEENSMEQDTLDADIDVEVCLNTSIIKNNDESFQKKGKEDNKKNAWGETNEFQNFLAKIAQGTDIKIKKANPIDSEKAPLQIPVLDPTENKKVEMFTQTYVTTKPVAVQTNTLYDTPMKNQVSLTPEQSEKACEFLSGIVKTTSELGQLMTQKSEDFIEKKINTTYVTDTFKMDYCVKKSFLLFKLAKHNLVQMEEDLSKHYEEFLKANDLLKHREQEKIIASTSKTHSGDSDCEIVEEPVVKKDKGKPAFNLKTVFLNKELSIKIAKKPAEKPKAKEKLDIKGRHTVWINDSIMVKKVKPTQSFLAQDSRNKKPPDTFVTLQMVNDFFKIYERQKAMLICAPYIKNEWFCHKSYVCCYFFENCNDFLENSQIINEQISRGVPAAESERNNLNENKLASDTNKVCPQSLFFICMQAVQKYMYSENSVIANKKQELKLQKITYINNLENNNVNIQNQNIKLFPVHPLQTLCYKTVKGLIYHPNFREIKNKTNLLILKKTENIREKNYNDPIDITKMVKKYNNNSIKSLFSLCVELIQNLSKFKTENKQTSLLYYNPHSLKNSVFHAVKNIFCDDMIESKLQKKSCKSNHKVKTLIQICIDFIVSTKDYRMFYMNDKKTLPQKNRLKYCVMSLRSLCFNKVMDLLNGHYEYDNIPVDIERPLNFTIDNVNTISEDMFLENTCQSYENIPQTETYIDNEEHNFSDDDRVSYDDEYREDDNNWVSQVQMQELRSCTDTTIDEENEKEQQVEMQHGLLNIKIEPLEEVPESIVDSSTIKIEPVDEEEIPLTPLDVITKQENIMCMSSNKGPIQRKNSNSYDVDAFEAFVASNKMILSICNNENEEIYSQSTSRVRRQYEPDLDNDIETYTDTMNLLVPQNIEMAKDRLMESSSDDENKIKEKRKLDKRKLKPKKTKKDLLQSNKEKQVLKNDVAVLTRKMREKIRQEEKKNQSSDSELEDMTLNLRKDKGNNDKSKKNQLPTIEPPEKEIQCNDVDSTEKIDEKEEDKNKNEASENVMDGITDGITSDSIEQVNDENDLTSSSVKIDGPIELIECQPTMPFLENYIDNTNTESEIKKCLKTDQGVTPLFTDRYGWKCYPIDGKDSKIYQYAYISLDKLPESFVETYFRYQDVAEKNQDDAEVDRLTNLNSLHRTLNTQTKEKSSSEIKGSKQSSYEPIKTNESQEKLEAEVKVEPCDELSPSEDERDNIENNTPSLPKQSSDNCLAKNSLMDDNSDSEKLQDETNNETKVDDEISPRTRSGRLVKSKYKEKLKPEDLMLTADKMMNKELSLLHAPVELKEEFDDKKDILSRPTRNCLKNTEKCKNQTKKETKDEDDSSSEEEKQWFTTKEKLLKRLQKKQDIPNVDDAKRAKIVSEFIEKRGDGMETRQRGRPRRRSKKKLLERRKQMKILSRELFGDESSHTGKKYSQTSVRNGRRNIRKVLDKKSLGRSTVLANMEEFERKQRLSQRQAQLREVLGCEEGVNVVVINDELCLEYDFEKLRPVVSVHPFFTKVMKAHQYEGVKFMWDACFESVSAVQRGAGGGCILAHCMGLGKTLQVLALLHTVLTHPKVGMRRVLVCCPLSTVLNWVDEINKWIGPVTNNIKLMFNLCKRTYRAVTLYYAYADVFELSKLKKTYERAYQLEDWYNGGGIFIIGYELFRSLTTLDPMLDNVRPTIVNKIRMALLDPGPDMIICDEGHLLKNDCSVLAVAMSRVVTKRRIVLTGTPMQNNLREYYCMVNFVKPNLLGTYSEYSNRFENPIMNGQHRDSREEDIKLMKARTHILHKVLEGCLQRQEASVLYPYLPKKHEYTVFISLTQCQRELYNHYLVNYTKETKQSVLKDFHVFQKIWTHPQVLHNFFTRARDDEKDSKIKVEKLEDDLAREDLGASEDVKPGTTDTWWLPHVAGEALHELRSSNKFLVVFRLLDECVALGDKVLIFSTSLYTMDALEFFLRAREWALGREYYRLDGSVPAEVRQKWCREFNAPHNTTTKLFLISTRAGCLGLNMTAANRVIILDTSWNPAHDIQSIFRVYRFGQKKDCYIYRLVAMGTMEQKIYERSVTKQAVACRVVDEQQIDRHYNMSELSELYKLDETGSGVSAGLAAGVRDAALLRVASADEGAALHAVHEHDSLLRGSSESGLNELERAAAWMQFQQEHTATHTSTSPPLILSYSLHDSLLRGSSESGLNELERAAAWMQFQQEHTATHTSTSPPLILSYSLHDSLLRGSSESGLNELERAAAWMQFQQEHTATHTSTSPPLILSYSLHDSLLRGSSESGLNELERAAAWMQFQQEHTATHTSTSPPLILSYSLHDSLLRGSSESGLNELERAAAWMQFQQEHTATHTSTSPPLILSYSLHDSLLRGSSESGLNELERAAAWMQFQQEHTATHTSTSPPLILSYSLHDSLLRGSSESGLNELERAAAWMQFQQEHTATHTSTSPPLILSYSLHDSLLRGSSESGLNELERAAAWMQFQQEHTATHTSTSPPLILSYSLHDSLLRGSSESGLNELERAAAWMQFQQEHTATHTSTSPPLILSYSLHDSLLRGSSESGLNELERAAAWMQFQQEHTATHTSTSPPLILSYSLHDSLLRGSSESGLNELERAAAWMQFQQEHTATHTKIQNIEIKMSLTQQKTDDKIVTKKEIKIEDQTDQSKSITEGKTRKAKKNCTTNTNINPQPSTSRQSDSTINPEAEETMIKKIMGILIRHNFHTTKTQQEISDLVVNVRNVVTNAKRDGLENVNPLIASIAKVLLESENLTLPEASKTNVNADENNCTKTDTTETIIGMPYDEDTDKNLENNEQDTSEPEYLDRKRRRLRRLSDEEYVPEPSQMNKRIITSDKRKTRKSNGNNTEIQQTEVPKTKLIEPEVSEPTEPQVVNDTAPSKQKVTKKLKNVKVKPGSSKNLQPLPVEKTKSTDVTVDESIILSDDDDEPLATPKPVNVTTSQDNSQDSHKDNIDDDEPVPLHQSLLTNKNFIKIVAHTYLSGNPMLDEDAAILAAQYSTLKALKETKATGKDIVSGPIYDIAVQVLGKSLLKKLHSVRVNTKDISASIKLETVHSESKVTAESSNEPAPKNATTIPETKVKNNIKGNKSRKRRKQCFVSNAQECEDRNIEGETSLAEAQDVVSLDPPTPVASTSQNVVPVGMFKGPASFYSSNLPSSQDECILPDDDDVIITQPNSAPPVVVITKRNSKQMDIAPAVSENVKTPRTLKSETATNPNNTNVSQQTHTSTTKPISIVYTAKNPPPNVQTNESTHNQKIESNKGILAPEIVQPAVSTQVSETICLDSDEEDAAPIVSNVKKPVRKALKSTTKPAIIITDSTVKKKSSTPTKVEIPTTSHTVLNTALDSSKDICTVPLLSLNNNCKLASGDFMINQINLPKSTKGARASPSAADVSKSKIINKANCKPGDIIRITESGVIEVLRRNENIPTSGDSLIAKNVTPAETSEVEIITDDNPIESHNVSEILKEKTDTNNRSFLIERKLQKIPEGKLDSILIEKNIQSKTKPPDPLLVLQDVIHIPADNYEESTANTSVKSEKNASKTTASVSKDVKDKILKRIKVEGKKAPPIISTVDLSNVKVVSVSSSLLKSKQEDREKVIDLTENFSPKNDVGKRVTLKNKEFVAIAGTSKDIIINKMGLLLNNSKNSPAKEMRNDHTNNKSIQRKTVNMAINKVSSGDSVKRPSPWQESSGIKKTKPNPTTPMTLQDFNIDDFDDIIELE